MLCEELMKTDVECVSPVDSIEEAARLMREANVGFLPVCDESRRVLGTITDRDIAIRAVADALPGSTPVEDVMTDEVVACSPKEEVEAALELMGENRKSRIICLDGDGRLAGVISLSDIAQLGEVGASDTLRQVSGRETRSN
jgi:CBS domain-containing protein